jgi:flagellar basal body-associated protein FliL
VVGAPSERVEFPQHQQGEEGGGCVVVLVMVVVVVVVMVMVVVMAVGEKWCVSRYSTSTLNSRG